MYSIYLVFSGTEIHMNLIATSLHFSIKITEFEEPERCIVMQNRKNQFVIDFNKLKFEVIGTYEAQ